MKVKNLWMSVLLLLMAVSLVLIPKANAAPIARITAFDGEVSVLSGYRITPVKNAGQVLNQGDRVLVKVGFATVTFDDGASLTINPYSSALIQQQEEESGFWIFKVKKVVRRLTCFVGKLKFKSGRSIKDNYLQTPTAVAGLRGTEAEIGYDNVNNYLNMISGEIASTYGDFIQGFFDNPGVDAATKSQVFQALEKAKESSVQGNTQEAQLTALEAIKTAAQELSQNPDPAVKKEAEEVLAAVEKQIVDVKAGITLAAPETVEATTTTGGEEATTTTVIPTTTTIRTTTTTTTTTSTTTTLYMY